MPTAFTACPPLQYRIETFVRHIQPRMVALEGSPKREEALVYSVRIYDSQTIEQVIRSAEECLAYIQWKFEETSTSPSIHWSLEFQMSAIDSMPPLSAEAIIRCMI